MRSRVRRLTLAAMLGGASPLLAQRAVQTLPPVPPVRGPLVIQVRYPEAGMATAAGDSTFLYGTVGDGRATLAINGLPVRVAPNGAWLAWIAIPHDSSFAVHVAAKLGADTASVDWPLVRAGWVRETGAWVDKASLAPVTAWIPAGEALPLALRAAPGASVRLVLPGHGFIAFAADSILPPVADGLRDFDRDDRNLGRVSHGDRYVAIAHGMTNPSGTADWLTPALPVAAVQVPTLEVALGADTSRTPWPISVTFTAAGPRAVRLDDDPDNKGGGSGIVIGRAAPTGTYAWFFPRGTRTGADARINNQVRLRLADDAIAWVPIADIQDAAAIDDPRPAVMASLTLTPESDRTRLRIPLTHPVPVQVDEQSNGLVITLFNATVDANWTRFGAAQHFVQSLTWRQETQDRVALSLTFDRMLWGWRYWVDGTDLVFEFRQPPHIDPLRPLAGRLIVVDAGHPPGGACGPTNLCEPEANLSVARRVRERLTALGAKVVMTRTDSGAVALGERVRIADSVHADLLVSIHNNGLPDGVNPFANAGTSTFFNHQPALELARLVQARLVGTLGLRDLGVARGDLALVRPTWYPAIMTEGLFMMFPEQEAALRSSAGQAAYAAGIVLGITDFLRETARLSNSSSLDRLR